MTCAPRLINSLIAASTFCRLRFFRLMKAFTISIFLPSARSISGSAIWRFAKKPSRPPLAIPMIPTLATSPSIKALVACVVEWATKITSSGEILFSFKQFWKLWTTPAATPRGSSCVVLTVDFPTISWVALSIATAFVWVPPTSMPILTACFMNNSELSYDLSGHSKCMAYGLNEYK